MERESQWQKARDKRPYKGRPSRDQYHNPAHVQEKMCKEKNDKSDNLLIITKEQGISEIKSVESDVL